MPRLLCCALLGLTVCVCTLSAQRDQGEQGCTKAPIERGKALRQPAQAQLRDTLHGHTAQVQSVAFSPDGKLLASAAGGLRDDGELRLLPGEVKVWDAQTGKETLTLRVPTTLRVWAVAFSPDGQRVAGTDLDGRVKVWDAQTGKEALPVGGHSGAVYTVAFSANGKHLASAGLGLGKQGKVVGELKVWNARSGKELLTIHGYTNLISSVAWSPDGKRLAGASGDDRSVKTVKVWELQTGQEALTLTGHTAGVWCVAFSPDGKRLASASDDETVKVWDLRTGQPALTLKGNTDRACSVAFSPDGKRLASAGGKTLKVWDAQTGQEILSIEVDSGRVSSVAFSPDGKRLASGGTDRTVRVWDLLID